ncbi:MAG TPA: hypothetical protein VG455_16180 [Acidimicrobiales bacterium]|nr:hypothetical protein [Acidimicrobiales bacterium]
MRTRTMLVHLNRPIRDDDEYRRLSDSLPVTAFHSTVGDPNHALGIRVEADTRSEAESAAYDLVAAVLSPDEIVRITGDDDVMQDRQVMFWLLATRQHVRAWEVRLAEYVRLGLLNEDPGGSLIWSAQLAHHMALVAGHNLLRGLDNAEGRYTAMPELMAREVEVLRNLHEHWDEQWPSFYDVRNPGPLRRSGQRFAELHPGSSPYWALGWNSKDGPRLGPGLLVGALHEYLDALEAEVLAVAPDLAPLVTPIEPTPWLGVTAGRDQWWPRSNE